jgi:hypothetical protein
MPYTDPLFAWELLGGKLRLRNTLETILVLDQNCGQSLLDVEGMRAYAERVILNQLRVVQAQRPGRPAVIPGLPRTWVAIRHGCELCDAPHGSICKRSFPRASSATLLI